MSADNAPDPESESPQRFFRLNPSVEFVGKAAAWVLLLFALVRTPWVQENILLPFAGLQGQVACALVGASPNSVFVGLSCTGADPMALVLGAILAFPVARGRRIRGAVLGLGLILVLNTARIGTLSLVVDRRDLFDLLHVYVWPAVLIVAAAAYVFAWMGSSLRGSAPAPVTPGAEAPFSKRQALRFLGLTSVFVLAFSLSSPWLMRSAAVLEIARWATLLAAAVMTALGVSAEVAGNSLKTSSGMWVVTQACVATPLVPVYLAAVALLPVSVPRRTLAALAAFPLFILLGSARLLVLALPAAVVGSHATAVHSFYQVLAATVIALWFALRSPTRGSTALRAFAGGAVSAYLVGWIGRAWLWPAAERLSESLHLGHAWIDAQGALALMPQVSAGLFVALWLALRRPVRGSSLVKAFALLALCQVGALVLIGELAVHSGIALPIAGSRAASLALPLIVIWLTSSGRSRGGSSVSRDDSGPTQEPVVLPG
jgi:exosortase/archaeosortase family protein